MLVNKTYRVIPFHPSHVQDVVTGEGRVLSPAKFGDVGKHPAFSVYHGDTYLMSGGVVAAAAWWGTAWLILNSAEACKHLTFIVRNVRRYLTQLQHQGMHRIEATCFTGTPNGGRLLKALGFELECEMALAGPRGETGERYVRLQWPIQSQLPQSR